jgi:hypothetical protein
LHKTAVQAGLEQEMPVIHNRPWVVVVVVRRDQDMRVKPAEWEIYPLDLVEEAGLVAPVAPWDQQEVLSMLQDWGVPAE